jgi:hypothetical protein
MKLKTTITMLLLVSIMSSCEKQNFKKLEMETVHFWFWDTELESTFKSKAIVKVWYTDLEDSQDLLHGFYDDVQALKYDLQNNPTSVLYNKTPQQIFTVNLTDFDMDDMIHRNVLKGVNTIWEVELIPKDERNNIALEWMYKTSASDGGEFYLEFLHKWDCP